MTAPGLEELFAALQHNFRYGQGTEDQARCYFRLLVVDLGEAPTPCIRERLLTVVQRFPAVHNAWMFTEIAAPKKCTNSQVHAMNQQD